jgi:3-oxoacyl-[acyl-carrier-protein] synthase-3
MPDAVVTTEAAEPAAVRTLRGAAIASVGAGLPERVVPNAEIAERLGVDDRWIYKRMGVRERRFAAPGERFEDLAIAASRQAVERAGIDPADIDLVIVATVTQDEILPNTSPLVAGAIGATRAGAIDLGAACTGFLAGVAMATGQIEAGRADTVLVAGGDIASSYLDMDDRRTAGLMGDGAGAVIVTAAAPPGRVGPHILRADAIGRDKVFVPRDSTLVMEGQATFVDAVENLSRVSLDTVAAAGLTLDDIDVFVYHQANSRILQAVAERLELDAERLVDCIETFGNTSAGTVPLALDWAVRNGRLKNGDRTLLAAIGAGWIWGGMVVEWGPDGA